MTSKKQRDLREAIYHADKRAALVAERDRDVANSLSSKQRDRENWERKREANRERRD